MNIFIVSIDEPLYVPIFLHDIIAEYSNNICGISILSPFSNKKISKGISDSAFNLIKSRIKYYGILDFIKFSFLYFLCKLKGIMPLPKGGNSRFYSLRDLAKAYNLKLFSCSQNNINSEEYVKFLKELNIDIIICLVAQIAREPFLKAARIGCLNTHCSLLPKYRGREPLFWALLNEDKEAGVTIHFMDKGIDTGSILKQRVIDISSADTLHSLYLKASRLGSKMMLDLIKDIENNNLKFIETKSELSSYKPWPSRENVALFRKKGKLFY